MSKTKVEIARSAWTADAFTALFDDYIVMDSRANPVPGLPLVEMGRDEVIKGFRQYWGTWDEYAIDPVEFVDAGQSVVVVVREHGRGKGSGVPVEREHFQLWTFRGGKLIRWEPFRSRAEALEAAGVGPKRATP